MLQAEINFQQKSLFLQAFLIKYCKSKIKQVAQARSCLK